MVSLKKSLFFASLQTALNALSLSFSFFKTVCSWIDKNLKYFLCILFLTLPFASFPQLFTYTFNIKIATLQYPWNLSYPFLAEPVAVYAIIIDSYSFYSTCTLLLDFSFRKDLVHYAAQILLTPELFRHSAADIPLPFVWSITLP